MTKLEFVNKFILQLFFVRLTRCREIKDVYTPLNEISVIQPNADGYFWPISNFKKVTSQWYSIMFWVVPFTGWNSKFKFIGKQQLKQITKKVKLCL